MGLHPNAEKNTGPPLFCGKLLYTVKDLRKQLVQNKLNQCWCVGFWERKLDIEITPQVWLTAVKASKETRLRLLQWKIMHNIYPTNIMLHRMKVREDNKCTYCRDVIDVIEHFFFECPAVSNFWKHIECYIFVQIGIRVKLDLPKILFGVNDQKISRKNIITINRIILVAKMCISIYKKTSSQLPLPYIFEVHVGMRCTSLSN